MNVDIETFKLKIKNKDPFAVIRPADGEYLVCTNTPLTNIDNWTFHKDGSLKDDLYNSIKECESLDGIYVGIPCKDCSNHIYHWYSENFKIPQNRLTYANVFCNTNWKNFTSLFSEDKIPFYYIGPYVSNKHNLNLVDMYRTDTQLVNIWDTIKTNFMNSIQRWVQDRNGIFLFSVGPISKILIPMLWKLNPTNIYLDVGSSFDYFMKGSSNREYMNPNSRYAKITCSFEKGHSNYGDITAVLTLYKRPQHLEEQIASIRNQTVQPKSIIVVKNYADGIEKPNLPDDIIFIDSSKNFGIWTRFAVSLLADTEYVCVFDDDTIPGCRWFENCLNSMKVKEGLYGTIGIKFPTQSYSFNMSDRVGWDNPNEEITQVDIVGHSWFFKRSWLHYLWQYTPTYKEDLTCAEDINFSFQLQKAGIPTYVPPHPRNNVEMYGSIPDKAWKYGCEPHAISMQSESGSKFNNALKKAIDSGFKLLCMS